MFMSIKNLVLILLFFFILGCSQKKIHESEPNDAFAKANKIEIDSVISGFFNTKNDIDFYMLELTTPKVIDIHISAIKGINHAFKIWRYDEGHTLIKYIDDLRKSSPERMCNLFADKGLYYIAIEHGKRDNRKENNETSYKLQLSGRSWDNEEREPNDDISSANYLEIGSEVLGFFSPAYNRLNFNSENSLREEDWYFLEIDLEAESPLLLDIELSGTPNINSKLCLLNSNLQTLGYSDSNEIGSGELLKEIGITLSGTYYIIVTSNYESNNDIPYRLLVTSRFYDYTSEIEPNNSPDESNIIIESDTTGRIYPDGDRDYYRQNITDKAELFKIEVIPPENLDIKIELIGIDNNKLLEVNNYGKGEKEIIPNAHISNDFFIVVSAGRGEQNIDFTYNLSVSSIPFQDNFEVEPNDSKELATIINVKTINGFISKKGDIDYYYLEYNKRVNKRFTIKGIKDSELKISITDSLGYIIKSKNIRGEQTESLTEMIDKKGYIIVESLSDNYEDPYSIDIGEK